ncbi:MAG: sulfur carrier protein ThiS adenylyltransferase ThiF [Bacteroidales bacterium]|nr:sulfur carrier protein ThiS adenylyltransferase ThiF [Bacteroidales bacterium]
MPVSYPEAISKYLGRFTVGIAGCGGLGSNCAVALARCGVGKLVIADYDIVTLQNLNRQYYFHDQIGRLKVHALRENIQRINPAISVKAFDMKLCVSDVLELFAGCDVIVEAFDKAEMKQMIIETVLGQMPGKYLISGIGMAGWGKTDIIHCLRSDRLIICGDGVSEVTETLPVLAPRVNVVANMQANEVLEILLKEFVPPLPENQHEDNIK